MTESNFPSGCFLSIFQNHFRYFHQMDRRIDLCLLLLCLYPYMIVKRRLNVFRFQVEYIDIRKTCIATKYKYIPYLLQSDRVPPASGNRDLLHRNENQTSQMEHFSLLPNSFATDTILPKRCINFIKVLLVHRYTL